MRENEVENYLRKDLRGNIFPRLAFRPYGHHQYRQLQGLRDQAPKILSASQPAYPCYMPVPKVLKYQNAEVSHNPRRIENSALPASGSAQPRKPFERTMRTLARTVP